MESVAFYKIMLELHKGGTDIDGLCETNGIKSDDFIYMQKTYDQLVLLEENGRLPSIIPSAKALSLTDYIKQKIWFLSGPDAYYGLLEDAKNLKALNNSLEVNVTLLTLDLNNLKKQIHDMQNRYIKDISELDKRLAESNVNFNVTFTIIVAAVAWFVGVYKK
jgi:hypothetical protein